MKLTIFYYTGTGNSLWVARTLAKEFADSRVISISDWEKSKTEINSDLIGLVFPVHIWGLPPRVVKFAKELKALKHGYLFAVAVDAGQVANTLVQLDGLLKKNKLSLSSGFEVQMPSNYIPWGGPGPKDKQNERFEAAKIKIAEIAGYLKTKEKRPLEKGPFLQTMFLSLAYKMSYSQLPRMDKSFFADEKCNKCGTCARVCPVSNITIIDGKPVWNHKCEQCYACLQWCPQKAIQYGKKTAKYERYHQTEITLKDMLK
jgi:ferredoxin